MKLHRHLTALAALLLSLVFAWPAAAAAPVFRRIELRAVASLDDVGDCTALKEKDRVAYYAVDDNMISRCVSAAWVPIANVLDAAIVGDFTVTDGDDTFAVGTGDFTASVTDDLSISAADDGLITTTDDLTISGQTVTISTLSGNGNVKVDPHGSGKVDISGANLINVGAIVNTTTDSFDVTTDQGTISLTAANGPVSIDADPASGIDLSSSGVPVNLGGKLVFTVQTLTVADSGNGSPATDTLTPTRSLVNCTCQDADGCAITLSETDAVAGQVLEVFGGSENVCTFADSAGVQELSGSLSLGANDVVSFRYLGSTWVQRTAVVDN